MPILPIESLETIARCAVMNVTKRSLKSLKHESQKQLIRYLEMLEDKNKY